MIIGGDEAFRFVMMVRGRLRASREDLRGQVADASSVQAVE